MPAIHIPADQESAATNAEINESVCQETRQLGTRLRLDSSDVLVLRNELQKSRTEQLHISG